MTEPTAADRPEVDDPRVLALAKARQQMANESQFNAGYCPPWDGLSEQEQRLSLLDARNNLRAALKAGLVPVSSAAVVQLPPTNQAAELTAEEARDLADELGTELYRAQDALAFVEECCVIADREQQPVTTADVREWLKGARCGRQLLADAEDQAALRDRIAEALYCHSHPDWTTRYADLDRDERDTYLGRADAVIRVLPAPVDQAAIERVRAVLETEAVVGRSALEYRGLITSALMAAEAPATEEQDNAPPCTCADAGACFASAGHYADCPAAVVQPAQPHNDETPRATEEA